MIAVTIEWFTIKKATYVGIVVLYYVIIVHSYGVDPLITLHMLMIAHLYTLHLVVVDAS